MKFNSLQPNDFVVITGHQEGARRVVNSIEREDVPKLDIEKKVLGFIHPLPLDADATSFWLEPNVLVQMDADTRFYENSSEITKGMFTLKAAGQFVSVFGVMVDDGSYHTFKASSIQITQGPAPIPGPKGPKPGDFKPAANTMENGSKPFDPVKPVKPAKPEDNSDAGDSDTPASSPGPAPTWVKPLYKPRKSDDQSAPAIDKSPSSGA